MINYKKHAWAEIDLDAFQSNLNKIKAFVGDCEVIAVIKADAYGHGAIKLGQYLNELGVRSFAVSCVREAIELRKSGIEGNILILGYTDPDEIELLSCYSFAQTVYSLDYAKAISSALENSGKNIDVHIKLNTGMNRLGFNCQDELPTDKIVESLNLPHLNFKGLFTHFAAADRDGDPNGEFTRTQYVRFLEVKAALKSKGFEPEICHCCNSAGTLLNTDMHLSAVRTGIILYGLKPDSNLALPIELSPVMSFKATVSSIYKIEANQGISYGLTFKTDKSLTAATVTVGYADGYPRFLSGCGEILINGKRCRILGRVCMDQMVVDVTDVENVAIGSEAVLIGKSMGEEITADEIAKLGGTINYEIVCGISKRVPRYYIKNGKTADCVDYLWGL